MSTNSNDIRRLVQEGGKYEINHEISEGQNAFAFRARHRNLNKDVFLKVYFSDDHATRLFQEPRYIVEATKENDNCNLVQVFDSEILFNPNIVSDKFVLVAMEYVDGGSILSRLSNGPLPLMDAIRASIGILHGLALLHGKLLVHRDLKPANILLTEQSGRLWPKITDFGSAARLESANAMISASRHSALYVPPEGWETPSRYCLQSDLYQVGLVLGEMLNGPLPTNPEPYMDSGFLRELKKQGISNWKSLSGFERCEVENQALNRHAKSGKILTFCPQNPCIPNDLKRIVTKATHPQVAQRFQSASEILSNLTPKSYPNWTGCSEDKNCYLARNWKNWDWRIEPISKSSTSFQIRKSRADSQNYRNWKTAGSIQIACKAVLGFS